MTRVLFAFIFVIFVIAATVFLWRKQISEYNFSFKEEKKVFRGLGNIGEDLEENLSPLEGLRDIAKELQALRELELATSTLDSATGTSVSATSSEEEVLILEEAVK